MAAFERLWIERKCGRGMSRRYILSSSMPLLIIFIITSILVFAIVFITSVSSRIERMLEVLGSGSIYAYREFDASILPAGSEISFTRTSEALVYAEAGERAVVLKGVDEGYFDGMRGRELGIASILSGVRNPLVLSSSLSAALSLDVGDRVTVMAYDKESGRTRPYLATVAAIFDSIYPQLDSRLVYAPLSMVGGWDGIEILLPPGEDAEAVLSTLAANDVPVLSARSLYRDEYSNAEASLSVLYAIFVLVAILAAYFSSDAADYFVSRDRNDIASLMIMGADRKRIERVYLLLTLSFVTAALALGTAAGIALSFLSPAVIGLVSRHEPAFLDYYVRSFSITVPWLSIALMILLSLIVSAFSIHFAIKRSAVANIPVP